MYSFVFALTVSEKLQFSYVRGADTTKHYLQPTLLQTLKMDFVLSFFLLQLSFCDCILFLCIFVSKSPSSSPTSINPISPCHR